MEATMTSIQPFFNWLLQATLSGSVIIGIILLAQKTLGGKIGPRWSHALWLVLLMRLVLPGTFPIQMDLLDLVPSLNRQVEQQQPSNIAEEQEAYQTSQITAESKVIPAQKKESEAAIQKQTTQKPGMIANLQSKPKPWLDSLRRALPFVWFAGALVAGLYLFMSNFFLWRIVKRERPLLDQKTLELFEECKEKIGVQTIVGLIPSAQIKSPALFGFIRPRLLLPKEMLEEASLEEQRYIFLHELAHLKRRDIYLGWLTSFLQILHWFNPLIWFAFYRMRADRELSCDALVLSRTGKDKSQEYGKAIVGLLRRFSHSRPLPAMAGILENKTQLKRRITMIAQFKKNSYLWSPLAIFLILTVCIISFSFTIGGMGQNTFLPKSEPTISLRRVETGPISDFSGPPSLDGRYICDYDERDIGSPMTSWHLVIRDLVSGDVRQLVEVSRGGNSNPIISPESDYVAYLDQGELKLINTDGTEHSVIYSFQEDERFNIRTWTPDGKQILGVFFKGDDNAVVMQLVGFSIEDNSKQVIHTFDTSLNSWRGRMKISPDGRYIAYDREQKQGSDARDIHIFDIAHNRTECVVQHAANDKLLGWTPDNNYIFFASDRKKGLSGYFAISATCNAYLLRVAKGQKQGEPELVIRDIPSKIRPKGFTRDGSYYYAVEFDTMEAVVADVDMQAGKLLSKPQAVGQTGTDVSPAWSPDGKYLAYSVHQSEDSGIIRIRNMESGQERELDPDLPPFYSLRWSPDGKFFLVSILESYYNHNLPQFIYRINASTGERTALIKSESSTLGAAQLSRDGRTLYFINQYPESSKASIMTKDMESGYEEELFSLEGVSYSNFLTFALSPDEQQLAIASLIIDRSKGVAEKRILAIPVSGGEPRELLRTKSKRAQRPSIAWTPDGQSLLFADSIPQRGGALFLIPAGGGQARELCRPQIMMYGVLLNALDVHPDGQRVAFDLYEYRHEVWAIANFLPKAAVSEEN
jgi:beta-lactamase regulating signal transducer with metallopeptidase domain/Tol biopolymer transport system component